MGSKYTHVFEPVRIRGVQFKNRLELAPPSPNLADSQGRVTTEFVDFFRPIARGGAAVIHVGNSVVDIREACDEERQLDLGTDASILPLTRFVEMCHGYGALASLEINHNGKDSDFDKTGRPASAEPAEKIQERIGKAPGGQADKRQVFGRREHEIGPAGLRPVADAQNQRRQIFSVIVRVVDDGSGPFRVPSNYVRTEGGADDTGTWESPNYNSAAQRVDLEFALGSGPVAVQ